MTERHGDMVTGQRAAELSGLYEFVQIHGKPSRLELPGQLKLPYLFHFSLETHFNQIVMLNDPLEGCPEIPYTPDGRFPSLLILISQADRDATAVLHSEVDRAFDNPLSHAGSSVLPIYGQPA